MNIGLLDSSLLGKEPRRTVGGLGALVVLVVAVSLAELAPRTVLADQTGGTVVWLFNGYVGGVLLMTMLATTVLGVVYGVWNGGPVLAIALPLSPVVTATVLADGTLLTTDLTIALCSGATGAVAGTETFWRHELKTKSEGNAVSISTDTESAVKPGTVLATCLGLSVGAVTVSGWLLWTLVSQAGLFHPGVAIGSLLLLVATLDLALLFGNVLLPTYIPPYTLFGRTFRTNE